MRVFIGIDLGSTTCKAVVLNEEKEIVGKGITNTRSNYEMATKIATQEALTDARFTLLSREGDLSVDQKARFEIAYHLMDYRRKHDSLRDRLMALASERGRPGWGPILREMGDVVDSILGRERTKRAIADRTLFFKDFMYNFYLTEAERFLPAGGLTTEAFMGLLDKVIVAVENEIYPLDPVEAIVGIVEEGAEELADSIRGQEIEVIRQVGTGYGRQLLPFPEEQIRSEILCHGKGAYFFFPETRTILDIGGQDTKAIQLDGKGVVRSFFMNDRCAAGCGRYLGYVAEEMAIGLQELGPTACSACRHIPINSTCTVFAGAELRDRLYAGEKKEEILLGLHRAIVLRAMSLLARSGGVFDQMTFTGGVAKNEAVVRILTELVNKNYSGITLNIHPDSIYMGSLGAALYAVEES